MTTLEQRALEFATAAHVGQARRYTGEPYIVHPIAVAELVKTVPHTPEMVAAALLLDVVEDCGIWPDEVEEKFGPTVRRYVHYLTDFSMPSDGNRERRKEIDRQFISGASPEVKTIKLADLIDNSVSIREHDPDFWKVYRHEKIRLLEVLREGDPTLWARAAEQCK